MMKKLAAFAVFTVILMILASEPLKLRVAEAQITNYIIKPDGSVEPSNPLMFSADNMTYALTDNMTGSVTVERSNIIIDGNGHTLLGADGAYNETAFTIEDQQNVTIQNTVVTAFYRAFDLNNANKVSIINNTVTFNHENAIAATRSTNLTVRDNRIANNTGFGIGLLQSSNSFIRRNTVANNTFYGIWLNETQQTTIAENEIRDNLWRCIMLDDSDSNEITANFCEGSEDGIFLNNSTRNDISGNTLTNDPYGSLWIHRYSDNNTVQNNTLYDNSFRAIWLSYSQSNTVEGNNVARSNESCIYVDNSQHSNIIGNTLTSNLIGAGITVYNSLQTSIIANSAADNRNGIIVNGGSENNTLYHNNLVNNTQQVNAEADYPNTWDNGLEGNYYNDYNGTDADNDGIGDTPQVTNQNNTDHFPLMGNYNSPRATFEGNDYYFDLTSNSTIVDFNVTRQADNPNITAITFNVTGQATHGFCRLTIPTNLISPPYNITIDNGQALLVYYNENIADNGTHRWIYFTYEQSTRAVQITPEFPSTATILTLLLTTFLMSTALITRRNRGRKCSALC